ncbi:MAG: VWA domain-containing protein [Chloroflexota bacterium]|nr:VWA domain-containing protein [Chloroflexota bacterium]
MNDGERLRRWRLILGGDSDGTGASLGERDAALDGALAALYSGEPDESMKDRRGGLGASAPRVARWLGDIRQFFPTSVVRIMQKDAIERLNLKQLLLEPELLETVEPDVHLAATLISLKSVMPETARESARMIVRRVVEEVERRIKQKTEQAITGAINRAARDNRRPKYNEIDWNKTIRVNLKHYQPEYRTIIPERRFGYGRRQSWLRDIVLCVDQSGSMASSVVYAGIFGAVMASLRTLRTRMVVFDTAVVDLTDDLQDPVELLFGTQLGGGTDINRALAYCQTRIERPADTILILISDLYEGGDAAEMLRRVNTLVQSGVNMIALLALSDDGAPSYDKRHAAAFAALGVPAFACTPDVFPDVIAAAITRADIGRFAEQGTLSISGL